MTDLLAMLRELQKYETPDGWIIGTYPGWSPDPLELNHKARAAIRPAIEQAVRGDELIPWGDRTFPAMFTLDAVNPSQKVTAKLFFMLNVEHEVQLRGAVSGTGEIDDILRALFRLRPLDWWKRKAITQLGLARDLPEGVNIDGDAISGSVVDYEDWMRGVLAPASITQQRRNNRITPSLLKEVAEVYRSATAEGRAPTTAVADYFSITRENAAKWVGRARREKFLGPSLGPTGGEGPIDD